MSLVTGIYFLYLYVIFDFHKYFFLFFFCSERNGAKGSYITYVIKVYAPLELFRDKVDTIKNMPSDTTYPLFGEKLSTSNDKASEKRMEEVYQVTPVEENEMKSLWKKMCSPTKKKISSPPKRTITAIKSPSKGLFSRLSSRTDRKSLKLDDIQNKKDLDTADAYQDDGIGEINSRSNSFIDCKSNEDDFASEFEAREIVHKLRELKHSNNDNEDDSNLNEPALQLNISNDFNATTFEVERRYHDMKTLLTKLSSSKGGLPSELQVIRSRLVYSTKIGKARLLERRDLLNSLLQCACSSPSLWNDPVMKLFLNL